MRVASELFEPGRIHLRALRIVLQPQRANAEHAADCRVQLCWLAATMFGRQGRAGIVGFRSMLQTAWGERSFSRSVVSIGTIMDITGRALGQIKSHSGVLSPV